VLNEGELELLLNDPKMKPKVLSTYFDIRKGLDGSLDRAIKALCEEADAAVRSGSQLLVLSDRSEEPVSTNALVCYSST
jgi:glutamate synthase (ferredoxin)